MSPHLVRLVVMFVLSMVVSSGAQQKRNGSQAPVPSSPPSFSTPVAYSTAEPGANLYLPDLHFESVHLWSENHIYRHSNQ